MKIKSPQPSTGAKLILSGLIAAAAGLALPATSSAQVSAFPFTLDGQFTNGVTPAGPIGEWSDVTPFAFFSAPGVTATPVALNNPSRNVLLYAAISHNVLSAPGDLQLHLMYDFLPRTILPLPGETFATVTFPVTLPGRPTGDRQNISVLFIGTGSGTAKGAADGAVGSFFDVFVDLDIDGIPDVPASQLGISGATGPGPSTLSPTPHLLVELEVPLRIPAGFANPPAPAGPLPGGGINPATGLYDPAPVFWGAAGAGNGTSPLTASLTGGLQSASTAFIAINPNGSLTVTPTPEPSTAVLLLGSLAMLGARRRKAGSAV